MSETAKVYGAIAGVMEEIGRIGISKSRSNQQQGYKFRGIDDVYNELNALLSKHRLIILPSVVKDEQIERLSSSGKPIFFTRLTVDFKLVCAEDGSFDIARTVGEAMDSADKSSNKAQSAAYKYAAMQVFCIPTEGDNDADAVTHELAPRSYDQEPPVTTEVAAARSMLQKERRELEKTLRDELSSIETLPALNLRIVDQRFLNDVAKLSQGAKDGLKDHIVGLREAFVKRGQPNNFDALAPNDVPDFPGDLPPHIQEAADNIRAG